MIEIRNITKKFDKFTVLENFSYKAENGSICGLIGYNGAGKTTLLKTVAGIYRAEIGEILIEDENIYENESLKRQLFMVQDEPYFLPQGSIHSMAKFYKGYYPYWSDKTCYRLSDIFGLNINARINSFSKGMQRQAALILGLSVRPKYLLLDESFDGLDLTKRNLVKDILLEYIKQRGTNILISSHNLNEMEGLCDYIGIIKGKHLAYASSVEEMRKKRRKYSVTLQQSWSKSIIEGKSFKNITFNGNNATFLYEGNKEKVLKLLNSVKVLNIETIPMTLEEIFLEESEEKSYDFQKLF